tara:strand:- start:985 stop:2145 length:1161 start_codon:yes stop_codon:yes gene_type:complete
MNGEILVNYPYMDLDFNNKDNKSCFNASISHIKDNLFVCSYRQFYRNKVEKSDIDFDEKLIHHPWIGGKSDKLGWNPVGGKDNTQFCIVEIKDNNDYKIVKKYDKDMEGQDARLFKMMDGIDGESYYVVSYNIFYNNKKSKRHKDYLMCTKVLKIDKELNLTFYGKNFTCMNVSNAKMEKNWSFWKSNNFELCFSYNIFNRHTAYSCYIENNKIYGDCKKVFEYKSPFLHNLDKYYKGSIAYSLSTPAIDFKNHEILKLSVGHIKFKYDDVLQNIPKTTNLYKYANEMYKTKFLHIRYMYLMYFYVFNIHTGEISKISNFFSLNSNYCLCFPSGICYNKDKSKVLVSYGEADTQSKIFTIDYINLLHALIPCKYLEPESIKFIMIH